MASNLEAMASNLLATCEEVSHCETDIAEPPMFGTLEVDGNFKLDAGCRYRVQMPQTAACSLELSNVLGAGSVEMSRSHCDPLGTPKVGTAKRSGMSWRHRKSNDAESGLGE